MSQDTLSDVLRAVRLKGAVFFYIDGSSPWAAEAPPARELIPAIMPGAEHLMEFHAVASGSCWASVVGEKPIRLDEGDVIVFPQGDPHVMSSEPGRKPTRPGKEVFFAPRPPQLPFALSLCDAKATTARLDGGGEDRATVVCGFLGLDARPFNPILASLPRVLHLSRAAAGTDPWFDSFLETAVLESNRRRPGGEALLERMSEMLFVDVLRRYVDGLPAGQTGWLAGMRDPSVGRVLALLHEKPDAPWTLERLADDAAMSRSTLHERFVHFIGQPPMHYLTQWRMQVATTLLRDTQAKLIEVALRVGYESEAAFSRAFKRSVGVAPGAWRAGRRSDGGGATASP
ncbi:MAG TPA: AraC family transcriptional regulator [Candidatus Polarisedimenticolaceae bacterium]